METMKVAKVNYSQNRPVDQICDTHHKDKSMNRNEASYTHFSVSVADNLFTVATFSGEQQSFRGMQQRLPKRQQNPKVRCIMMNSYAASSENRSQACRLYIKAFPAHSWRLRSPYAVTSSFAGKFFSRTYRPTCMLARTQYTHQ